jgi:Tol biopolymer transport system component
MVRVEMARTCVDPDMSILLAILTAAWLMPGLQAKANDHRPIWLPDGRGIVVMSDRTGDWELYRMALDGSGLERLTRHPGWDGYADVSPDGRWLLFDRNDDRDGKRVIRLDLVSRKERELLRFSRDGGGTHWSPDGTRVAYWEDAGDGRDIYLTDADGARRTRVTRTPESEHGPVFSRDGHRLTVVVNLASGTAIDDMALDGTGRRRLLTVPGRLYGLSRSPDGASLAFNAEEGGHQRLLVMNTDGTNRRRLSGASDVDHLPVWSKDGKTLMFTTERGDREFIQLLDVDTNRRRDLNTGAVTRGGRWDE